MIHLGQHIRLTQREIERFTRITAIEPVNIRTFEELESYVERCKSHYWGGVSRDAVPALADRQGVPAVPRGRLTRT